MPRVFIDIPESPYAKWREGLVDIIPRVVGKVATHSNIGPSAAQETSRRSIEDVFRLGIDAILPPTDVESAAMNFVAPFAGSVQRRFKVPGGATFRGGHPTWQATGPLKKVQEKMYEVVEKQPNMLKASGRTYVSSNSDLPGYASFSEELLTQGVGRDDAIVEGLQGYRKAFGELKEMLPKWVRVFRGEGKAHQFEALKDYENVSLLDKASARGFADVHPTKIYYTRKDLEKFRVVEAKNLSEVNKTPLKVRIAVDRELVSLARQGGLSKEKSQSTTFFSRATQAIKNREITPEEVGDIAYVNYLVETAKERGDLIRKALTELYPEDLKGMVLRRRGHDFLDPASLKVPDTHIVRSNLIHRDNIVAVGAPGELEFLVKKTGDKEKTFIPRASQPKREIANLGKELLGLK